MIERVPDLGQQIPALDPALRTAAEQARGFMPPDEGEALYELGARAGRIGPLVEVGTYCGKSTIYLAAAARVTGTAVITIDHHRGSEEHQPGWEYHEPDLVDPEVGRIDTLPSFRRTAHRAGVEADIVAIVARSEEAARWWRVPAGLVFVDGGHTDEAAQTDYRSWAPHVAMGGMLVIHDVFERPEDGGQAPYRIYQRGLASGAFAERRAAGSLRALERITDGF